MTLTRQLLLLVALGAPATLLAQTQNDLFDDSVVHEVRFTMSPASWQTLKDNVFADTNYTVDSFQWKGPNGVTAGATNLVIHSRGHGSRDPRKPGLHVSFNTNVKTQTFLGLTDLDLKSNTEDGSLLRERLSMKLFIRMGVPASREVHTRVYVNNEYIGLFNLVEAPDADLLTRLFNENNGYLYQFVPGDWAGPGLGWRFEYLGPNLDNYANADGTKPFVPKTHANAPDTVSLEAFFRTLNQEPDATFLSAMASYLDVKPWLLHLAVENYVSDPDSINGDIFGANNFYLYRFQALPNGQPPKPLFKFVAWDKDLAFGSTERDIFFNRDRNVLIKRLFAIPEYLNYWMETMQRVVLVAGGAGGWFEQEARREYAQIQQAAYDDTNKLTISDGGIHIPVSNADFDKACAYVISFPGNRSDYIVRVALPYWGGLYNFALPPANPSLPDGGFVSVGSHAPPVAAGGAAELYGANFGTADTTQIYVNGFLAPLLFSSGGQVDVQVPWEANGDQIYLGAIVNGSPSNLSRANVRTYAPAILAVTHTDGASFVTDGSPASAGETLVVYMSGLGPVSGPMIDGQKASGTSLQSTKETPVVAIGGVSSPVVFSGLTPGFLGLYQVNVTVPAGARGSSPLTLTIGGLTVQTQVAVR
jgi:uncharacterized protein (TIGR03437 family)